MSAELSKSQIDRLGDRLRDGSYTEADLGLLDDFRLSFAKAYQEVERVIRDDLRLPVTGRAAKSTLSIVQKLRRETMRLTRMQDISGCRVIVPGVVEQDRCIASLVERYPAVSIVDRRAKPSHGYRAVHVIPKLAGKRVEIQVRTEMQQLWAELSERCSDVFDPRIKYGGGDERVRNGLRAYSEIIVAIEHRERKWLAVSDGPSDEQRNEELLKEFWSKPENQFAAELRRMIDVLETSEGRT